MKALAKKSAVPYTETDLLHIERLELAKGSFRQGEYENAQILADDVLRGSPSPVIAVRAWIIKASFCNSWRLWGEARACLEQAAPLLELAPLEVQASFFNERARTHKESGRYDAAFTDYAGAAQCWEERGAQLGLGAVANNLAGLYLKINQIVEAKTECDRAKEIFTSIREFEYLGQAYDTEAGIFLAAGRLTLALRSADKAVSLITSNRDWLQAVLMTRGKVKVRLRDPTARVDFDQAIAEAERLESKYDIAGNCCAAIRALDLPVADLIAYYERADIVPHPDLILCARKIIGLVIPRNTDELDNMQVAMIKRALIEHDHSVTNAATSIGMSHQGMSYVIDHHKEKLGHLRKEPRIRRKSIIKKHR